jgi:hypothetical protein
MDPMMDIPQCRIVQREARKPLMLLGDARICAALFRILTAGWIIRG